MAVLHVQQHCVWWSHGCFACATTLCVVVAWLFCMCNNTVCGGRTAVLHVQQHSVWWSHGCFACATTLCVVVARFSPPSFIHFYRFKRHVSQVVLQKRGSPWSPDAKAFTSTYDDEQQRSGAQSAVQWSPKVAGPGRANIYTQTPTPLQDAAKPRAVCVYTRESWRTRITNKVCDSCNAVATSWIVSRPPEYELVGLQVPTLCR
jgi:hypothetical protein